MTGGDGDSPSTRQERGAATRQLIIDVATGLFAERGYEGTSIEAVLEGAGVSRGSLYHHFGGKDALFDAVIESVEERIGAATLAACAGATDAAGMLRAGCVEWVRLAGDPVVRRILLIDAPAVLGWEQWRALDERHALGLIRAAVEGVAAEGRVDGAMVDVYAHVIMASMNELALMVARAPDTDAAVRESEGAVTEVLDRLLGQPGASTATGEPWRDPTTTGVPPDAAER
jgi:AcrR family transcriptional regulator